MASNTVFSPSIEKNPTLVHWLVLLWVLMLILGTWMLSMPGALQSSQQISFNRSFFMAANVSTLTGFPVIFAKPEDFKPVVQIVFLLQLLSGLLLTLVASGLMLNRILDSRHRESRIITSALLLIIFAGVMGIATNGPGQSIIQGLLRGLAALGGSALVFGSAMQSSSGMLHLFLIPISWLGGMGSVLLCDLYDRFYKRRALSNYSMNALSIVSILYLAATIGFLFVFSSGSKFVNFDVITQSGALSGTIFGSGYTTEPISQLPRAVFWIILAAMLVGSGTAGTNGWGFAWMWTLQKNLKLVTWGVMIQLGFVLLGLISLSYLSTQLNTEQTLMLTIGSLSNIGIPFSPVTLSNSGLTMIGLLMVIGRVFPLVVMSEIISSRDTMNKHHE